MKQKCVDGISSSCASMCHDILILDKCLKHRHYTVSYHSSKGLNMKLTIAELADATKQRQDFIRQHISRNHLKVQREGRNVFVDLDEATRWAHERGLSLDLPAHVTIPTSYIQNRTARMTVLTWHPENANAVNLFTLIRHRRREALGPWAGDTNGTWSSEVVLADYAGDFEEFRLHVIDAPLEQCQRLVNYILTEGKLEIEGVNIEYALEQLPRIHWTYRDERYNPDHSIRSPFSNHSAKVEEYWSFMEESKERWLKVAAAAPNPAPLLKGLGISIERLPDRVGNLMIAAAEDTVNCDLSVQDKTLILRVDKADGSELPPYAYTATVWGTHSGDDVVRREMAILRRETIVDIQSEVDHIGFAIYENRDGRCIDLMDAYLIMSVSIAMNVESGPTVELNDRRRHTITRLNPSSSRSVLNIEPGKNSAALDKQIRRQVLSRRSFERDAATRREGNFGRFGPDQFDEAVEFFLGLVRRHTYSDEPIHLADPYFRSIVVGDRERDLYLRIFDATRGRSLQILCSPKTRTEPGKQWWADYPKILTSHVTVRELVNQRNQRVCVFHDRYLVAGDKEILISHSFNGWAEDGVTFVCLPYGVYRAEAEEWWTLDAGLTRDDILINEVK